MYPKNLLILIFLSTFYNMIVLEVCDSAREGSW